MEWLWLRNQHPISTKDIEIELDCWEKLNAKEDVEAEEEELKKTIAIYNLYHKQFNPPPHIKKQSASHHMSKSV